MATEKRKPGKARMTPQVDAEAASLSPFMRLAAAQPEQIGFPTLLAKQGLAPEIGTVVYIHGINNKPVASVLAKAEPDPQFPTVDVAFGQPDPDAVAAAPKLKWVHVSSSGITRYDTPSFRALVAARLRDERHDGVLQLVFAAAE